MSRKKGQHDINDFSLVTVELSKSTNMKHETAAIAALGPSSDKVIVSLAPLAWASRLTIEMQSLHYLLTYHLFIMRMPNAKWSTYFR